MSVFKLAPPAAAGLSWWRVSLAGAAADEPVTIWYEVATDGKALRSVEVTADGKMRADAVANYPSGATPAGFGSLIGVPFFDLDWAWPDAGEDDAITPLAAMASEFAAIWAAATA